MKFAAYATLSAALWSYTRAVPVMVWKDEALSSPLHSSELIDASKLFNSIGAPSKVDSSLASVVFVLGRDEDGSEALTRLSTSGSLPNVASKYESAHTIYHHVRGMESPRTVARDLSSAFGGRVLEVTLGEFNSRMTSLEKPIENSAHDSPAGIKSKAERQMTKRSRALSAADILVVNVPSSTSSKDIDTSVHSAIHHSQVSSVVLTAVRSIDEVKFERMLLAQRGNKVQSRSSIFNGARRRLEDNQAEGDDGNNQDNAQGDYYEEDEAGTYYVYMTPNILSGILFTLMFAFVAYTGITCMGMISGQDVYVNKMPAVGREA